MVSFIIIIIIIIIINIHNVAVPSWVGVDGLIRIYRLRHPKP
jgi:hypothetical protein